MFSGEWNDIPGTATGSEPALRTASTISNPTCTLHSGNIGELGVGQHRTQISAQLASIDTICSMSKEQSPKGLHRAATQHGTELSTI